MPAPERMLTYLRQAIALVRATPGRRGHTVDLVDATDILVTGDLHGHVGNFQVLLKAADLAVYNAKHSGRNCVRVFTLNPPKAAVA